MTLPNDVVCQCRHWSGEHDSRSSRCTAPRCPCDLFRESSELNTPEAIAGRGEEHRDDCACALCRIPWADDLFVTARFVDDGREEDLIEIVSEGGAATHAYAVTYDTARRIVVAVNSHHDVLSSLTRVTAALKRHSGAPCSLPEDLDAALEAEGAIEKARAH